MLVGRHLINTIRLVKCGLQTGHFIKFNFTIQAISMIKFYFEIVSRNFQKKAKIANFSKLSRKFYKSRLVRQVPLP